MSARRGKASQPESLVQRLLQERRELLVSRERLRLELAESKGAAGRSDPRLLRLEAENRRLRLELAEARASLEALESGLRRALEAMERASTSSEAR